MTHITNGPGRHYILLEVETRKGVTSLADKVAGRAWTLEGVVKTQALALDSHEACMLAMDQIGSRLMNERRREKPALNEERATLMSIAQPALALQ